MTTTPDLAALPLSSRRWLWSVVEDRPGRWRARFRYFDTPRPETVCRHFEKAGYDVRRWDVADHRIDVYFVARECEE